MIRTQKEATSDRHGSQLMGENPVMTLEKGTCRRRDSEDAVVMALDYFNGLMETVHLLKSPENVSHLEKSINIVKVIWFTKS